MTRLLWFFPILWALMALWIVAAFVWGWWCDYRDRHDQDIHVGRRGRDGWPPTLERNDDW